jgi:hypothetical protein
MPKNRIIQCIHCNKPLYELLKNIKDPRFEILCAEYLKPFCIDVPEPKAGDLVICPFCKKELMTTFIDHYDK